MNSPFAHSGLHALSWVSSFRLAALEIPTLSLSHRGYKLQSFVFGCQPSILLNVSSADTNVPRSNKVVQRILDRCKAAGVKLCSLALCVPQTWSRRETLIQEYLGPILDETVAAERVETMFALEAQCQAQHLISKYPRELRDCNEMMVLDFGGHSMVFHPSCHSQLEFYEANFA